MFALSFSRIVASVAIFSFLNSQLPSLACECGSEALGVAAVGGTMIRRKDPAVVTDSIWGNLILQMAYERDAQINE